MTEGVGLDFLDASALVKLVVAESESSALRDHLIGRGIVASGLVRTEVPRAIRRSLKEFGDPTLKLHLRRWNEVAARLALRPVSDEVLDAAGEIASGELRSLDAIHLVTAIDIFPIDRFITYDRRQAAAADDLGLSVASPA